MYNGKSATTTRALLEFILRSESPVMFAALVKCGRNALSTYADVEHETAGAEDKLERSMRKAAFREEQAKRKLVG
jgi:hypothetical protein